MSGAGKSQALGYEQKQLQNLDADIRTDLRQFKQAQVRAQQQNQAQDIDDDGDAEMSVPPIDYDHVDFDKVTIVNMAWNNRVYEEYLLKHAETAVPEERYNEVDGDRIKAMVQDIIRARGRGFLICHELDRKMSVLKEQGDTSVSAFFIHLCDKHLPRRKLSTKGFSTPGIMHAACAALFASTSETIHQLLLECGLKAVYRRTLIVYVPKWNLHPFKRQFLGEEYGEPDEELERYRLKKYWDFLYKAKPVQSDPEEEEKQNGAVPRHFLKEQIDVIAVGRNDTRIHRIKTAHMRTNTTDDELDRIEYPEEMVDENGNFRPGVYTAHDFYHDLKLEQWKISANASGGDSAASVLANDLHVRVFMVAFAVTARKKMLNIERIGDEFVWEPFEFDVDCLRDARRVVEMADNYAILLSTVPASRGKGTPGKNGQGGVVQADAVQMAREVFLKKVISLASPTVKIAAVLRSVQNKKLKGMKRAQELYFILSKLKDFNVTEETAAVKKSRNKKSAADGEHQNENNDEEKNKENVPANTGSKAESVTRKQLSTCNMSAKMLKSFVNFLEEYGQTLSSWTTFWGSSELLTVMKQLE
eukprot:CAMPEP_0202729650 /NCGR_PEP_ID=MMETSP1385-20130828/186240_1 /ASSEMBLY_ACC=CAM_ASM_000861 /TAXON_ID=933848 /ORGANISM="Elphidium margaritaceum" /LENGTH=587 /DNA_ID=CAMNT_0049395917 /DNA_START=896 /DNA_END=2659 /DNA_ORIENTATION=+